MEKLNAPSSKKAWQKPMIIMIDSVNAKNDHSRLESLYHNNGGTNYTRQIPGGTISFNKAYFDQLHS